ncbi:MAG: hypothetical protein WAO20_12760 [Acidobacteriota bacterium]
MNDRIVLRVLLGASAFLGYGFLILLYLHNESNRHLLGVVVDSLGLTGVTILFLLLLLHISGRHLGPGYFRLRRLESSTALYPGLGERYFKRIIERYPVPATTRRIQLGSRSRLELQRLDAQMRNAEEVHVLGFLVNLVLTPFSDFCGIRASSSGWASSTSSSTSIRSSCKGTTAVESRCSSSDSPPEIGDTPGFQK